MPTQAKGVLLCDRLRMLLLCTAMAAVVLGGVRAASASAGDYLVSVCAGDDSPTSRDEGSSNISTHLCEPSIDSEGFVQEAMASSVASGAQSWTLQAPIDTKIHQLLVSQQLFTARPFWPSGLQWTLSRGVGAESMVVAMANASRVPANRAPSAFGIDSEEIEGRMACLSSGCDNEGVSVTLRGVRLEMEDEHPPLIATTLASIPTAVRGTFQIPYLATDEGGGIKRVLFAVDDNTLASASPTNGGHCSEPFKFMAPCVLTLDSSFALDTTGLSDGLHTIELLAFDAANNEKLTTLTLNVHNAPTNTARPSISGPAKIGGHLLAGDGSWEGDPATFAYQWLRCPPSVTEVSEAGACQPISGETKQQHEASAADVYQRDLVRVTATNSHGSESALSTPSGLIADAQGLEVQPPPDPQPSSERSPTPPSGTAKPPDTQDITPPVLTDLSLTHRRFRVGKTDAALTAAVGKGPSGTVLKFTSSEAGRLSISIVPVAKKAKPIVLTRTIAAGSGRVALSGRIATKPMRPGHYKLSLAATDAAGNASKQSVGLSFTVLRG
jgi:hypothetical protein